MAMNGRFIDLDPARTRRIGTALVAGAALACLAVMLLLQGFVSNRMAAAQDLRAEIARYDALAARAPQGATDDLSIAAETPRDAQSQMQVALQTVADAHGVEVETIRPVQTEGGVQGLDTVGLVLTGAVTETALEGFLSALSEARPFMEVTELDLRRARVLSRAEDQRRIAVRLFVRGYLA